MSSKHAPGSEKSVKPSSSAARKPETETEDLINASNSGSPFLKLNNLSGGSDAKPPAISRQLAPRQQQALAKSLASRVGNSQLQRMVGESGTRKSSLDIALRSPDHVNRMLIQRTTLQENVGGDWSAALTTVNNKYISTGGVVDRQKDAVRQFAQVAQVNDPPSISEQMMLGSINLLLGAAMGGIGTVMLGLVGRMIQPALIGATRATMGTAVDSADVRGRIRASATSIVEALRDAGKERVQAAVASAWSAHGAGAGTSILQFQETQIHALNDIGQRQSETLMRQLGQLRSTTGEEDEWGAVNTLYGIFNEALDQAYNQQFNKMTDTWFTMQNQTVGPGVRPGMLRVELDNRYPNAGTFSVTGSNLNGEGSNADIRGRISQRTLEDIQIPKVIRMRSGSMGYGILDCDWYVNVTGAELPSSTPTISAPRGRTESLLAGPQQVQSWGGNRWGSTWLAAFHLGLQDLDNDDARNTAANQQRGAEAVWNAVKGMRPGSVGDSSWS
ncbi:MAG: hypothetical protein IAE89_11945 [Anaerolineae bacterium]|nr:hypothetical protein [Anaerolineae bacterium]